MRERKHYNRNTNFNSDNDRCAEGCMRVKIKIMSDLHIDFAMYNDISLEDSKETILILAGDICEVNHMSTYVNFLNNIAPKYYKVLIVLGNHEFYRGSYHRVSVKLMDALAHLSNVYIMNRNVMVIDDITFIGATLWTDCNKDNPIDKLHIANGMNDCKYIRYGSVSDPYKYKFNPDHMVMEHYNDVKFLEKTFSDIMTDKVVVITHHAPTLLSIDERYTGHYMNSAYVSDLSNFILDNKIDLWIHGHVHNNFDYMVGDTRVICNPRGYGAENINFNPNLIIEL